MYFLDGKTKAVGVDINCTAQDALYKIQEKICLKNLYGWALYEVLPLMCQKIIFAKSMGVTGLSE